MPSNNLKKHLCYNETKNDPFYRSFTKIDPFYKAPNFHQILDLFFKVVGTRTLKIKKNSNLSVTPEALAKAGFRYTNQHDMVICDYCDGRLQRWEETDNPVEEHVRHYGNRCPFMFPLLRVRILFIKIAETSFLVLIFNFISLYQVY